MLVRKFGGIYAFKIRYRRYYKIKKKASLWWFSLGNHPDGDRYWHKMPVLWQESVGSSYKIRKKNKRNHSKGLINSTINLPIQ